MILKLASQDHIIFCRPLPKPSIVKTHLCSFFVVRHRWQSCYTLSYVTKIYNDILTVRHLVARQLVADNDSLPSVSA